MSNPNRKPYGGRKWENDFFDIDFPTPPREITPDIPGAIPKFEGITFVSQSSAIRSAFNDARNLYTRGGKPWDRRNPPKPFADTILQIFKSAHEEISKRVRTQLMLVPTIGTSADIYHGIDGIVCLSNGRPLITFDLSLNMSTKEANGIPEQKADVIITPVHLDDNSLFSDLRDQMLQIVLQRLVR